MKLLNMLMLSVLIFYKPFFKYYLGNSRTKTTDKIIEKIKMVIINR